MNAVCISPETVAQVTGGRYVGPEDLRTVPVTSCVLDSREIRPGCLFVCLPGEHTDGHQYASAAIAAGAALCLVQKPVSSQPYVLVSSTSDALRALAGWYRRQLSIPIVGVVGSVGKTTAKEMISSVLSVRYAVHKTPKNLNTQLGVPLTVLGIRKDHEAAVIEMGISEFGQMAKLGAVVQPDVLVFTAICACHLEFLHDLDGVLRAKSEIFAYMRRDALAILSGDEPRLRDLEPGMRKRLYGFANGCDYQATDAESLGFDGVRFTLHTPGCAYPAFVPSFGSHLPAAAAAAAAVADELGLTRDEILEGFRHYAPVGGRANVRTTAYLTVIDDCYNANPASVTSSLSSLASLSGRRVAILGDMKELGEHSAQLHADVGRTAASLPLAHLLFCGPESRHAWEAACDAGAESRALWLPDKAALLAVLPQWIQRGDTVLVKASHSMQFEDVVAALVLLS